MSRHSDNNIGHAPPLAECESDEPSDSSHRSPILHDELVVEILLRVPVKFLVQFRCVSKSWKSLISDPQFVRMHLQREKENLYHRRLLFFTANLSLEVDSLITCSVQSLVSKPSTEVDARYPLTNEFDVVGSCNGLLCLKYHTEKSYFFRLWNPSTRWVSEKSPILHWNDKAMVFSGFGYDHLTDNYKVVGALCNADAKEVRVWTVGANSWRQIQNVPYVPQPVDMLGKFVCGTLNWLAIRLWSDGRFNQRVMSLEMGKESFTEILLPHQDDIDNDYSFSRIGVLRDRLCYYDFPKGDYLVLWLMKEYGVKESWSKLVMTKLVMIDLQVVGWGLCYLCYTLKPLFLLETGEILFGANNSELIFYNPRDNTMKCPEIKGYRDLLYPSLYIESLVSL